MTQVGARGAALTGPLVLFVGLLAGAAALAGCGREDPAETRADVARAETEATEQVAAAREAAADTNSDARHEAAQSIVESGGESGGSAPDANRELRTASAEGAYAVAVAQAEGAHRVAVERCDALSGDARLICRDRADAELQRAKARAQAARDGRN
ncbi:MAG: hypothetical protein O9284_12490 [Steroidobacteraceae bacterium]|jgi:hypothetical protein|nr:hypothetical protein [Steroidobacteraceae bacterium]